MKIISFKEMTNELKLRVDSLDDMYLLNRIIGAGDVVESSSFRRFKASETDIGEQKEVVIRLRVEKIELDRTSNRLRFNGKILSGHPEEFIRINSYHTINVAGGDVITVQKQEWKSYILQRLKQAVLETAKPKLGIIAMDDEKATLAYAKGYGIEIITELYSHLSKRMKEGDYQKQREAYFKEMISSMQNMHVGIIVLAGPGFTKDDVKKYMDVNQIKVDKQLIYVSVGDSERSGVREAMRSEEVSKAIERQSIKREFDLLNMFLTGLRVNSAFYGASDVDAQLDAYAVAVILANDSAINDPEVQKLLDKADSQKVEIEIFNSEDEAGMQLANFKNVAAISKALYHQNA